MTANDIQHPLFIIGGTFDPIHYGHLRMAIEVRDHFPEAEIAILPCGYPGHRSKPVASAWQRLAMVQRALENIDGIGIRWEELDCPGPHFTIDTARRLRTCFPHRPIVWVIGSDASGGIRTWRGAAQLSSLVSLLCCQRPNYPVPTAEGFDKVEYQSLTERAYGQIATLTIPMLDISSTMIRERLAAGRSIFGLVPESVCHYIEHYQIYRQTKVEGN